MGFIVGPTVSGVLANYFGNYSPIYLCTLLYLIDLYLLYKYFPDSKTSGAFRTHTIAEPEDNNEDFHMKLNKKKNLNIYSVWTNPREFFNLLLSSTITYLLLIQFCATLVIVFLIFLSYPKSVLLIIIYISNRRRNCYSAQRFINLHSQDMILLLLKMDF